MRTQPDPLPAAPPAWTKRRAGRIVDVATAILSFGFVGVVAASLTVESDPTGLAFALFGVCIAAIGIGLALVFAGIVGVIVLPAPERPLQCRKCGYDLRGLPEPRCPECGTPFEPPLAGP